MIKGALMVSDAPSDPYGSLRRTQVRKPRPQLRPMFPSEVENGCISVQVNSRRGVKRKGTPADGASENGGVQVDFPFATKRKYNKETEGMGG